MPWQQFGNGVGRRPGMTLAIDWHLETFTLWGCIVYNQADFEHVQIATEEHNVEHGFAM
jgi:hypothetical protein